MLAHNRIAVLHGVNLDQLGRRDPAIYGDLDYDRLTQRIGEFAAELELSAQFFQTNFEGDLVEHLHRVSDTADGIIINPGAWTHYSYAIADACAMLGEPLIEVHISNIYSRETFRHHSYFSDIAKGIISGFGVQGYLLALQAIIEEFK